MKIVKRILALLVMLMSVLLGLLSIGGIIGAWSLSNSLTHGLVTVLSGVDTVLGTTEDALNRVDSRVGTARDEVAAFEEAVVETADEFADKPTVLTAVAERLDLGIGPAVASVRDTVQSVRETLLGIQNAVQAINALPFVSLGGNLPGGEKLAELSEGVTALDQGIQELRDGVREARTAAAAQVVLRVGKATARVDSGLATIQAATTGMASRVSETRTEVATFQARATLWLDLGAVALTVLFLWILFAHVVTFVLGLSLMRDKNLFGRWLGGAAMVPAPEPAEPVELVEPAEPVELVETAEPVELAEPAEPVELVEAVEPDEPAEAVEPDELAQPVEPDELAEPSEPDGSPEVAEQEDAATEDS